MLSKLATQSFNILRLIARIPNFLRPKVPDFNVSRLSRLKMIQNGPRMTQNHPKWPKNGPQLPQMAQKWARALWANLSLSRARSELRDWLTRPLLGSERRSSAPTLYATLPNIHLREKNGAETIEVKNFGWQICSGYFGTGKFWTELGIWRYNLLEMVTHLKMMIINATSCNDCHFNTLKSLLWTTTDYWGYFKSLLWSA